MRHVSGSREDYVNSRLPAAEAVGRILDVVGDPIRDQKAKGIFVIECVAVNLTVRDQVAH